MDDTYFYTRIINYLTAICPILILAGTSLVKGTSWEVVFNSLSFFAGAILLCFTVYSFINEFESKKEKYIIGRRNNKFIADEALKYISSDINNNELTWFFNYVGEADSRDDESIGVIDLKLKQEAYRHSLKKLSPGSKDVVCAICGASPFFYKKGSCETCGNTPKGII